MALQGIPNIPREERGDQVSYWSIEAIHAVKRAEQIARTRNRTNFDTDCLLAALLELDDVRSRLARCGADVRRLQWITRTVNKTTDDDPVVVEDNHEQLSGASGHLRKAVEAAKRLAGDGKILPGHLLAGLFQQEGSTAKILLTNCGMRMEMPPQPQCEQEADEPVYLERRSE